MDTKLRQVNNHPDVNVNTSFRVGSYERNAGFQIGESPSTTATV